MYLPCLTRPYRQTGPMKKYTYPIYPVSRRRLLGILLLIVGSLAAAQDGNPLLQGLYSEAQAARGALAYGENCASCHANDLRGNSNSPALTGLSFLFLWEGRDLAELFTRLSTDMPTDRPGSLPTDTYLDLLAFLLQHNGYPASTASLDMARLEGEPVIIVPPPE